MSENKTDNSKFKYMITMRWYVETDEDMVAGAQETDQKLLELLRHKEGRFYLLLFLPNTK